MLFSNSVLVSSDLASLARYFKTKTIHLNHRSWLQSEAVINLYFQFSSVFSVKRNRARLARVSIIVIEKLKTLRYRAGSDKLSRLSV